MEKEIEDLVYVELEDYIKPDLIECNFGKDILITQNKNIIEINPEESDLIFIDLTYGTQKFTFMASCHTNLDSEGPLVLDLSITKEPNPEMMSKRQTWGISFEPYTGEFFETYQEESS